MDSKVKQVDLTDIDLEDRTFCFRLNLGEKPLVESIRRHGQKFPAVLRPGKEGEKLQIVSGFRRIAALQSLGGSSVLAFVEGLSDEQAVRMSILENQERKSLGDLDRAYAIIKAQQSGMTYAEMERLFNLSERQLRRLRDLTTLPEALQTALADGRLQATHAVQLQVLKRTHPELDLEQWIGTVAREGLSVRALTRAVNKAHPKGPADKPLLIIDRESGTIRFSPRKVSFSDLDDARKVRLIRELEEAIALLRSV